jgi:pyruvate,orthophosphate dikinase
MCQRWISDGPPSEDEFRALVAGPLDRLRNATGLGFGDPRNPLLVSVRSGASVSMPGMLETVLDVGLTHTTLPGLIAATGNPRLAWDCYLRLIRSYAATVEAIPPAPFESAEARAIAAAGAASLAELNTLDLRKLVIEELDIFRDASGEPLPQDCLQQLLCAVDAVFRSWNADKAKRYRCINRLEHLPGTAVTVQRMVYGNAGPHSGAGVGFTRDPATGDKQLYLDFAFDAQGEDVVAGRHSLTPAADLTRLMPEIVRSLNLIAPRLEQIFHDAQDFEFTVEEGRLFLLQARDAKCAPWARLRIAVDLANEGLITPEEALRRIDGLDFSKLVRRHVAAQSGPPVAHGIPAGAGVATGEVAFTGDAVRKFSAQGRAVILVRNDIATEDIDAIASADGVLTARGGRTSHAAVVARELGKVAIVGCRELEISDAGASCTIAGHRFENGAQLTLDGETGNIYSGAVSVVEERPEAELAQLASWRAAVSVR